MEFALVLPVLMLIVVSAAELGLAFGNLHTVGYGSREAPASARRWLSGRPRAAGPTRTHPTWTPL